MSCTDTDDSNMPTCANCGKRSDDLKACTSCDLLKYCSEACQELHKPKHRGECNKRTSELDEALFKLPPKLEEDCPICFLRMPLLDSGKRYHECCGKTICSGCFYASAMMDGNVDELCPFCRSPNVTTTSDMEEMNKMNKRAEEQLNHKMEVLNFFEHVSVNPPLYMRNLEETVKLLEEKKAYFETQPKDTSLPVK